MPADVLYVTFDGVLQPLAFSQVIRVIAGLAESGLRYHLLSVERPADLANARLRRVVEDVLRPANVAWTPIAAASMGTARQAAQALARAVAQAAGIVRREGIGLVHARAYHGAFLARVLKQLARIPYIFDARGYWIEERSGPGEWFSTATSYAMGKFAEQALFRGAAGVVTLTELQASDLAAGLFGPPPRRLAVIPTCTDYDAFCLGSWRPGKPLGKGCVPDAIQHRLTGKLVIGIVGALNSSYYVKEAVALAKSAAEMSPQTHLLILSHQEQAYAAALRSATIAPERYTLASADHWAMPDWLQWIDWGLLLLPETAAKRASMPTKLAEFFATGVRPVFFGCNSEATRWVERAGSGYILPSIATADLQAAARAITDSVPSLAPLRNARAVTEPHFGLASGVERYASFVRACLSGRPTRN